MFNFLVIFLLIIKIFKSTENNADNNYLTINDKFSYMQYKNDTNEESFVIYLGNELIYINFKKSNIINFNTESISFSYNNNYWFYPINSTKIYYEKDGNFCFINERNKKDYFIIKNGENIIVDSGKIKLNGTANSFYLLSADDEYALVNLFWLSYILVLIGCIISLYGAHHYIFSLVFHIFFLFYFFSGDIIINIFNSFELYIYYILFFCFLVGVSSSLFLKINIKNRKVIRAIDLMYGGFFGFSLFKTVIYYYIFFEFSNANSKSLRIFLYFFLLIIFISAGVIISWFDKLKNYRYLPCSAVAGSFYIIKGIQYIVGGYFSSILFIEENLEFKNLKDEILNYSLTYFLIHFLLIVLSIFFQIKYIQFKNIEIPEFYANRQVTLRSGVSDLESNQSKNAKDEQESFIKNRLVDSRTSNELDGQEEINDQED